MFHHWFIVTCKGIIVVDGERWRLKSSTLVAVVAPTYGVKGAVCGASRKRGGVVVLDCL